MNSDDRVQELMKQRLINEIRENNEKKNRAIDELLTNLKKKNLNRYIINENK